MLSINPFILFVNSSLTPTFSLRKEKVGPKETSTFFAKRKEWNQKKRPPFLYEKKRVEPKETNCGAAVFIWVEKFLRSMLSLLKLDGSRGSHFGGAVSVS